MSEGNAPLLISGNSRTGKTSLIGTAAAYLRLTHGRIMRLYSTDGGAYPEDVAALIELGAMEVWRPRTRIGKGGEGLIEETCSKISQGYWPAEGEWLDRAKGITKPGCKLVPPVAATLIFRCPTGHEVLRVGSQAALQPTLCKACPGAGVMVTLANGSVESTVTMSPGFERVGGWASDGLTSMSDWVMASLAGRRGNLELHGEKDSIGRIASGDEVFGGNNRADFMFSQSMARLWLLATSAIPMDLKIPPIWTSLETRVDEGSKVAFPFYGPQMAGSAKTGAVSSWVGDYLGTQVVRGESGRKEWRLYLTHYYDSDNVVHPYNVRVSPGVLPEFLADAEGAPTFSGFNLGVFFKLREQARIASGDRYKAMFKDAPPIPAAMAAPVVAVAAAPVVAAKVTGPPTAATMGSAMGTTPMPPRPPAKPPMLPPMPLKTK